VFFVIKFYIFESSSTLLASKLRYLNELKKSKNKITMKKIAKKVFFGCSVFLFFSCTKHEVVPPPQKKVTLMNRFVGKIDNVDLELMRNVNGYIGSSFADVTFHFDDMDSLIYHSYLSSPSSPESIDVGHGSIILDLESSADRPSLPIFEQFYKGTSNQTPLFSTNGINGFTVTYVDKNGKKWTSNQAHIYPLEQVKYDKVSIESDADGDYALFTVQFSTYLYSQTSEDSLLISDASYTGWYKR